MEKSEVRTHYRALQNQYGELADYTLQFNRTKRMLGQCNYTKKLIKISEYHLEGSEDASVLDTLKHECAHAYAYEKHGAAAANHGYLWQQAAVLLGANPSSTSKTAYTKQRPASKYTLTCPQCGAVGGRHRMAKGARYSCGHCHTEMIITKNW